MVDRILAFFGYVKVPKEAINLTLMIEKFHYNVCQKFPGEKWATSQYEAIKEIRMFLQTGRLLT